MNSTGQNSEKTGYRVLLLLVVGLTAFSSAMKELNQLQQFTLDASRLVAQWSDKFAPAPVPAVPEVPQAPQVQEIQHLTMSVETCELKQSPPSVELPWLSNIPKAPVSVPPRAVTPRPSQVIDFKNDKPSEIQLAKLKKLPQFDLDPAQFSFTITGDGEPDVVLTSALPVTQFKARTRKHHEFKLSPRDREMLLKTFNRSISLRIAS